MQLMCYPEVSPFAQTCLLLLVLASSFLQDILKDPAFMWKDPMSSDAVIYLAENITISWKLLVSPPTRSNSLDDDDMGDIDNHWF